MTRHLAPPRQPWAPLPEAPHRWEPGITTQWAPVRATPTRRQVQEQLTARAVSPTQVVHPWRAMARTLIAVIGGIAAGAPQIYEAITMRDPSTAVGGAGTTLLVAGAITRLMALPIVDHWLRRLGLSASPARDYTGDDTHA